MTPIKPTEEDLFRARGGEMIYFSSHDCKKITKGRMVFIGGSHDLEVQTCPNCGERYAPNVVANRIKFSKISDPNEFPDMNQDDIDYWKNK